MSAVSQTRTGGRIRRRPGSCARPTAEARWAARRLRETVARRLVIPFRETPTSTPDRSTRVRLERDVPVPMRDGIALSAHVFHPADVAGPLPVVLIRQPYGKDAHPFMHARGKYWARKGYVCVVQDVRGKYGSQGQWEPFVNEADDGWDTLDWIAGRPWCNGDIGMAGESYHALTQWAMASSGHPNLRCLAPGNTAPDLYRAVFPGGAFALMTFGEWAYEMETVRLLNPFRFDPWHLPLAETADAAAGRAHPTFRAFVEHPCRDPFWDRRDLSQKGILVPAFHWGGWYDVLLDGTLQGWRAAGAAAARHGDGRCPQSLTIAPTDHALTPVATGRVGRIDVGHDRWSYDRVQRFFDHWLRNEPNRADRDPSVNVFVVGRNQWRSMESWPPPDARPVPLYLHSRGEAGSSVGGTLTLEPPTDEPSDDYVYDPRAPVSYWLTRSLWDMAGELDDRRPLEARTDVLTYSTPVLGAGLELVGPLTATLFPASSAPDTDFTMALVDVFPDGFAQLVQEGVTRLSALAAAGQTPDGDGTWKLEVDLCATAHWFAPGHRLRVEVSSSNFGRLDRNLNTGYPFGLDAEHRVALQSVFHDRERPSHLLLPVTAGEALGTQAPATD